MDGVSHVMQDVVGDSIQSWLAEHPVLAWIVAHPLWTIVLLVLTLFLCWSLLGAIAQLMQQVWLALLQAPLKLAQWLSRKLIPNGLLQSFLRKEETSLTKLGSQQDLQEQLPQLLNRLEALRQEQEALIKEMQSMLISKP
ncbi:MAG: hypothetical protein ACAF41_07955 [Leptolyngbya sp. BL-A-14]